MNTLKIDTCLIQRPTELANRIGRPSKFCSARCRNKLNARLNPSRQFTHVCAACGDTFTGTVTAKYCSKSCYGTAITLPRPLCRCGSAMALGRKFCSPGCAANEFSARGSTPERIFWRRFRKRDKNHVRRARIANVPFESVSSLSIYERDNWTCGICKQPIDKGIRCPDPRSPSIDHIVAIVNGGPHVAGNLQAAHFGCNSRKRAA
jgi:hypothetical protein